MGELLRRLHLPSVPPAVAVLEPFLAAGVLRPTDVHLAAVVVDLVGGLGAEELLAVAIASRGPSLGHVCIDMDLAASIAGERRRSNGIGAADDVDDAGDDLPWPEPDAWIATLMTSAVVSDPDGHRDEPRRPLVLDGRRLYLERYFRYELAVAADLVHRVAGGRGGTGGPRGLSSAAEAALDELFDADPRGLDSDDLQRRAAGLALAGGVSVIAGGPGTGKTRTIARLLAAALQAAAVEGRELKVALAAPTGKAAARMTEAVHAEVAGALDDGAISPAVGVALRSTVATTIHTLLGWRPGTRFRHDRESPLTHDLVVVDETSMVSLPLIAKLLDAIRPAAGLVLVGDPDQLASVEAGTVMGDIVGSATVAARSTPTPAPTATATVNSDDDDARGRLAARITVLSKVRRFAAESGIAALADAVRSGDSDAAVTLLVGGHEDVTWVRDDDLAALGELESGLVAAGVETARAAFSGDAAGALSAACGVKVLAAVRHAPLGRDDWSQRIEAGVAAALPHVTPTRRWYVGRPIIVGTNDRVDRVSNGDVGVVVRHGDGVAVALADGAGPRWIATSRLADVETWWAMTIHKSQGSEFAHAVVSLPADGSPILTRELLYTAITRARTKVSVVGSETAIRGAIERPIGRASGLRDRLWPVEGRAPVEL